MHCRETIEGMVAVDTIVGDSPPMRKVLELVQHVAKTDATVLKLSGEALRRIENEAPDIGMAIHRLLARLLAIKLRQTNSWLSHLR